MTNPLPQRAQKRLLFHIPFTLVPLVEEFQKQGGYRSPKEACLALLEASLAAYPRWGLKRGHARVVGAEIRTWIVGRIRENLIQITAELDSHFLQPMPEDAVEHEPDPGDEP